MEFSPDWSVDADAKGWHDSRHALIGRTAAVHRPWARTTPKPETPTRRQPLELSTTTTEYRARKKELEHGRALPGDPSTTVAYRSAFAWSQHGFAGGHYKQAE